MQNEWLQCVTCQATYDALEIRYTCDCGGLLSVERPAGALTRELRGRFDDRCRSREAYDRSGVWRFREAVMDVATSNIITHPEGNTRLYQRESLSAAAGVNQLWFKHEGENPTASFKDRGMTVAVTQAKRVGAAAVACASTGNTSASLAAYAAHAGMRAVVFVPSGKISMGKLAQTLAYGALCLKVRGDFDAAMTLVREAAAQLNIYLLNSINPFRIEGQKTIVWELLQDLGWEAPDWIVLPAGNLGNTSAFGKALREAHAAGWIDRVPRIASVQASGANPFFQSFASEFSVRHRMTPETVASAIRIGDPVSYEKAKEAIVFSRGVVAEVTDAELMASKREIDRAGIGCEPASAVTLAGVKQLIARNVMRRDEKVVCVLTGHLLKDVDSILATSELASQMMEIDADVKSVADAMNS